LGKFLFIDFGLVLIQVVEFVESLFPYLQTGFIDVHLNQSSRGEGIDLTIVNLQTGHSFQFAFPDFSEQLVGHNRVDKPFKFLLIQGAISVQVDCGKLRAHHLFVTGGVEFALEGHEFLKLNWIAHVVVEALKHFASDVGDEHLLEFVDADYFSVWLHSEVQTEVDLLEDFVEQAPLLEFDFQNEFEHIAHHQNEFFLVDVPRVVFVIDVD